MSNVSKRLRKLSIAICLILPIQAIAMDSSQNTDTLVINKTEFVSQDDIHQNYIGKVGLNEALLYTQTYGELAKVMMAYFFVMNTNYCIEHQPNLKDELNVQTQSLLDKIIYFEDANFRQTSDYNKPLTPQRSEILLNVYLGYANSYNALKNQADPEQYCLQYADELEKEKTDIQDYLNQALTTIQLIANNAQQDDA